jgi:predicted small secreted protein
MRKFMILAALAASLSVAACNTVEGAGKDVSSAGKAVSDRRARRHPRRAFFMARRLAAPRCHGRQTVSPPQPKGVRAISD